MFIFLVLVLIVWDWNVEMSIFLNFQYETINSDNFNESLNINCSILIILIPNILYSIVFRVLHWCANLLMDYFYCYHTMDKRHESQLNKQIRLTQVCISIHDYLKMFSPSIAHQASLLDTPLALVEKLSVVVINRLCLLKYLLIACTCAMEIATLHEICSVVMCVHAKLLVNWNHPNENLFRIYVWCAYSLV